MKLRHMLLVACALMALAGQALAQEVRNYRQGPVTALSYVKVKPGKFDEYMRYLAGPYRTLMEENKKAGLITGWAIYSAAGKTPNDPDLVLATTYPNMAAFDRQDESDAVTAKVMGAISKQNQAFADRSTMRDVLGGELVRELVLK
jgi:hypothetical protein